MAVKVLNNGEARGPGRGGKGFLLTEMWPVEVEGGSVGLSSQGYNYDMNKDIRGMRVTCVPVPTPAVTLTKDFPLYREVLAIVTVCPEDSPSSGLILEVGDERI